MEGWWPFSGLGTCERGWGQAIGNRTDRHHPYFLTIDPATASSQAGLSQDHRGPCGPLQEGPPHLVTGLPTGVRRWAVGGGGAVVQGA